ncbi:MAG: DUF4956 domain-containing protein [Planctomycetota bacterium]|jgi:hypothetical protein
METLTQQFGLRVGDLQTLLINLVFVILLAQLLSWHYRRHAQVLSNKPKFARLFVFVAVTTFLMITVVKSSFALSLGLVGALSIIRFRTPIKEPEELAYLFLAIALGVGLGAGVGADSDYGVEIATGVVFLVLLTYMSVNTSSRGKSSLRSILQVSAPMTEGDSEALMAKLLKGVETSCHQVDVRRMDVSNEEWHGTLLVELTATDQVDAMLGRVRAEFPGARVSLIERDGLE